MNKKGATDITIGVGLVILLALAVIFAPNIRGWVSPQAAAPAPAPGAAPQVQTAAGVVSCQQQTDGTNTVDIALRNVLSSTLDYNAGNVYAATTSDVDGILGNATTGSTTSLSYTSMNIAPCKTGKLYVIGDGRTAATTADFNTNSMNAQVTVPTADAGEVFILFRTGALASDTSPNSTGQDAATANSYSTFALRATTLNFSMANGEVKDGYIDLKVQNSSSSFGYYENGQPAADGTLVAVDLVSTSKFSVANGFAISSDASGISLQKITCPAKAVNNQNADVCFQTRSLTSSDGTIRFKYTLKADTGNPAYADSPRLFVMDKTINQDDDGRLVFDYASAAGTDWGVQNAFGNFTLERTTST